MKKILLLLGLLNIYKYPLFLIIRKSSYTYRCVQRDTSRYLRRPPESVTRFMIFCNMMINRNLTSIYLYRIKTRRVLWVLTRLLYSYNKNIEINVPVGKLGGGFIVYHNIGAVIRAKSVGEDVVISQGVTIGAGGDWNDVRQDNIPTIGSRVLIATNSVVIGDVKIGDNAVIGAGSVITKNVGKGEVVVGNPQRVIKTVEI